jgi:exopolyphosphatase/guanosine-5'-triphosphate,3'-diphosphate pyrophosphatase
MTEPRQYTRRLACIDIGTLTCRLLIADLASGHPLKELRSERRILRLGEGVDQTKRLGSSAIDRVIQCLREWRQLIDSNNVEAAAVVATSAVRDAANRDEFLKRVKREAGFDVEVISGEEEARRTLLGIRSGLPLGVTDILALDIGGGSTEFILNRPGQKPIVRSIDIGVVRLCERGLKHDPPTAEEIEQARKWVKQEAKAAVAGMGNYHQATFVGTAGTITSLAAMDQKLPTYEPARIHNYRLKLETIRELEQTLLSRTKAERVGLPGLEKNREEVIAAGAIIVRTIMEMLGQKECLVSDFGLREGVLIHMIADMDAEIRKLFHRIHEEALLLFYRWKIYRQLFAGGHENLDLLNRSGSNVFVLLQDLIQENIFLTLCRLTDPEKTGAYENLSLRNLLGKAETVFEANACTDLRGKLQELAKATDKLRVHRSKRIAHLDLTHAINPELLPAVQYAEVEEALSSLESVMRELHQLILDADTSYREPAIAYGCDGNFLLGVLREVHKCQGSVGSDRD